MVAVAVENRRPVNGARQAVVMHHAGDREENEGHREDDGTRPAPS
jgi:hypothetical protein